ncbi:MAG: hypothetical protein AAGA28_04660 [Pseudomonadota bacterium]
MTPRPADQTVMMIAACVLFLGGLLIGLAVQAPGAPIVGMAHELGLLEAVFMLVFVALRPYLYFNSWNAWLFCGLAIVSLYCNFLGVSLTVLTGAGAGMYLPPWGSYVTDTPSAANTWVGILLNMSAAAVALPLLLLGGWIDRMRSEPRLQGVMFAASLVLTAVFLVLSFFPTLLG